MTMIGSDQAHATTSGQGSTVAVVDTGADFSHPDLAGRLIRGHDFVDGDEDPSDQNNHGTHVTGIVAANAGNGIGVEGVAPLSSVLVVRVLDASGGGTVDAVAQGIDYARTHGAQVINLSLGTDVPLVGNSDSTVADAIQRALNQGIVVVAAAGNSSMPICDQPSLHGPFMCVAAVDRQGRAFYSNFSGLGSAYGISAPGGAGRGPIEDDIFSTIRAGYGYMAGTSQATPHVSGVAALLVSLGLRGQAVVNRIVQTARDAGPPGPDPIYGAGIVDARAAVAGFPPLTTPGGARPGSLTTPAGGPGSAARISMARVQSIRSVLRYGLLVRCRAAGGGLCTAQASASRRRIANGSSRLTVGRTVLVRARVTSRGRSLLLGALGLHRSVAASVRITVPGVPAQSRPVTLRP
jgi:thermitase